MQCRFKFRLALASAKRVLCSIVLGGAAACVPSGHVAPDQAPGPRFDALTFFEGHTRGEGTLKVALHRAEPTTVEGIGRVTADRTLVLDQSVQRGGRQPARRQWRLRSDGHGGYSGSLTDAVGLVHADVDGSRLHISFTMKRGLKTDQWLYLERGGMVARNVMIVRKLGVPVARLDETITRTPEMACCDRLVPALPEPN